METTKRSQETDQTNKPQHQQTAASATARNTPVSERVTNEVKEVADKAKDMAEGAKEKLTRAYDRTAEAVNGTYQKAVEYGKENPGKTTLIAFGVGVGVGMLLASGRSPRGRGRFVPPVMNALSEIATQLFR
jgi:ElaB/YqjD/DUF883 family membrane-anchored ribosome-binding protein